jgi:hypothetical protein
MNGTGLREGLLGAESASPELERKYREGVRVLFERRLTPLRRRSLVFSVMLSLALAVFFVAQFVRLRGHETAIGVVGIAVGFLFSVGWGLLALSTLRRGTENLRFHGVIRTQLIWAFTALLMGLMLWAGLQTADAARGNRLILYGLVFFVAFGIPYFVAQVVQQSELRVREDVLRLELALAQLGERTAKNG